MPVDPSRVFVYGTLQPGRLRWPYLEPFAAATRPAEVVGLLYDSGYGWPVATFTSDDQPATATIPGVLVDLHPHRVGEALVVLDDVEATATDLLVRIAVTTTTDERAWAYHCATPEAHMVRIPRWEAAQER